MGLKATTIRYRYTLEVVAMSDVTKKAKVDSFTRRYPVPKPTLGVFLSTQVEIVAYVLVKIIKFSLAFYFNQFSMAGLAHGFGFLYRRSGEKAKVGEVRKQILSQLLKM